MIKSSQLQKGADKMDTYNSGEYLLELVSCACSFGLSAIQTIFKVEKRLADRIGERDASRVYEGDLSNAPTLLTTERYQVIRINMTIRIKSDIYHQRSRDIASQGTGSKEKTPR